MEDVWEKLEKCRDTRQWIYQIISRSDKLTYMYALQEKFPTHL